ncbi:hypothetical protein CBL_05517 [Carabus blaptoides fortunei]
MVRLHKCSTVDRHLGHLCPSTERPLQLFASMWRVRMNDNEAINKCSCANGPTHYIRCSTKDNLGSASIGSGTQFVFLPSAHDRSLHCLTYTLRDCLPKHDLALSLACRRDVLLGLRGPSQTNRRRYNSMLMVDQRAIRPQPLTAPMAINCWNNQSRQHTKEPQF